MQTQETNVRICPKCGKTYKGHPAISRVDNETPICRERNFDPIVFNSLVS